MMYFPRSIVKIKRISTILQLTYSNVFKKGSTDNYIYINCLVMDMYSATHIFKTGIVNTTWLKIEVSRGIKKVILIPFYRLETSLMFRKV